MELGEFIKNTPVDKGNGRGSGEGYGDGCGFGGGYGSDSVYCHGTSIVGVYGSGDGYGDGCGFGDGKGYADCSGR